MLSKKVVVVLGLCVMAGLVFAGQGYVQDIHSERFTITSADGTCGIYPKTGGQIQSNLLLDSLYMRLVGYYGIGPNSSYIVMQDDYLFVDAYHGFAVYGIEPDKMAPQLVATHDDVPHEITGIAVKGNYLYACRRGDGVYTYDISDLDNWQLVDTYEMPDSTKSAMNCMIINDALCFFTLRDNLYETDSTLQLVVCSLEDPARPTRISSLDIDYPYYKRPGISGDSIILGSLYGEMAVIDISNVSNPHIAAECDLIEDTDTFTTMRAFYYDGEGSLFASFCEGQSYSDVFKSYDVSDFTSPQLLDSWPSVTASFMCPMGSSDTLMLLYAYESPQGWEHWSFDVSDPADLKSIAPWQTTPYQALGIGLYREGRFYFTDGSNSMLAADFRFSLSDPLTSGVETVGGSAIIGTSNIDNQEFFTNAWSISRGDDKVRLSISEAGEIEAVEVFEPYCFGWGGQDMFLADDLFGDIEGYYVAFFDVSVSGNSQYLGMDSLPIEWFFGPTRLFPDENLLYASQGPNGVSLVGEFGGLAVVDISDPTDPLTLVEKSLIGRCSDVEERDSIVYVTGLPDENRGIGYLEAYRFTGNDVEELAHVDLLHPGLGLELVGDLLYLTRVSGFEIYDVSDPTVPIQLCNIGTTGGYNDDVVVFEDINRAFVTNDHRLLAFDVSDPSDPQCVGYYSLPTIWGWFGWRQRLRTDGHYLYWGTVSYGICVIEPYGPAAGVSENPPGPPQNPPQSIDLWVEPGLGRNPTIHYSLPHSAHIEISAYGAAGRRVECIYQGTVSAGEHQLTWAVTHLPAGVYFIKLTTENESLSERVVVFK